MEGAFWQDLRVGRRSLARRRGSFLVAVLALALGIGANSAIFSVVDTVLFQPLPYQDPDRLVMVREDIPAITDMMPITSYEYLRMKERTGVFERLSLADLADATLLEGTEPESIAAARVTPEFFQTLGVSPRLGRSFSPADAKPGAPPVALLTWNLWQRRFGGQPSVVGRTIRMNVSTSFGTDPGAARLFTVAGVLPPAFRSPFEDEEIWVPMGVDEANADRTVHALFALGRLRPGVSVDRARAELTGVLAGVEPQFPLHQGEGRGATVAAVPELLVRNIKTGLRLLAAAVGLVLLIACANVANLQLAWAVAREREMALRSALGAGRGRLVRQLLTESLLLAVTGGLLGLALAWALIKLLVATSPGNIPRLDEIGVDGRVLLFTLLVSVLAGVLFGLVPALRASRPKLQEMLQAGGRSGSGLAHERLRGALVIAEVALAMVVLVGAGLLLRSFRGVQAIDYGFDPRNVLTADISLPQSKYPEAGDQERFFRQLLERVQGLPGVRAAAVANVVPLTRVNSATPFNIEGRAPVEGEKLTANYRLVTPGYFAALRVPLRAGRLLGPADVQAPPHALLVDQTFADKYFPGGSAVGHRLVLTGVDDPVEIVGVVGNVQHKAMTTEPRPTFYMPWLNTPAMTLLLRTATDPLTLAQGVRQQVHEMDPELPVTLSTLDQIAGDAVARPRFNSLMMGVLAAVGLLLSLVGLYAVLRYSVAQRTREIGIRMALGAPAGAVQRQVLARGVALAAVGAIVGLAASIYLSKYVESQLYEIKPTDPWSYAGAAILLLAVGALAAWLPARSATRVDPIVTLRTEP
jgi:putative ABC transport system permease protein